MIGAECSFSIFGLTPTMARGLRLKWSSMTLPPAAERLEVETTCFYVEVAIRTPNLSHAMRKF